LWDIRNDKPVTGFGNRSAKIKHVAYDPHNQNYFAVGDAEGSVKIWD